MGSLKKKQKKIRNEEIHHTSRIGNVARDDSLTFSRVLYVLNFTQEST